MASKLSRREILKLSGLATASAGLPFLFSQPARTGFDENKQNVLIVLFDTLSAKHLSVYGYPRETMPGLSKFLDRSTVFHRHFSTSNYTTPATASLLTGTYPWTHKALRLGFEADKNFDDKNIFALFDQYYRFGYSHNPLVNIFLNQFSRGLDEYLPRQSLFLEDAPILNTLFSNDSDIASLAKRRILAREGLQNSSVFFSDIYTRIASRLRARQNYFHLDQFPRGLPFIDWDKYFILETAIDWMQMELSDFPNPFFAYFHFWPPHYPYNTRVDFIDKFDSDGYRPETKERHLFDQGSDFRQLLEQRRIYDEYILYVDAEFSRLYDHLEKANVLDNTWVIFTSDHGDMFERGILGHNEPVLYDAVTRVPLMISAPGQKQRIDINVTTSAVDLLPTLLHVTHQPIPEWVEGQVLPTYREDTSPQRSIYGIDARDNRTQNELTMGVSMNIQWPYKLIYTYGYPSLPQGKPMIELYDIENDPEEINDLSSRLRDIRSSMLNELKQQMEDAYSK